MPEKLIYRFCFSLIGLGLYRVNFVCDRIECTYIAPLQELCVTFKTLIQKEVLVTRLNISIFLTIVFYGGILLPLGHGAAFLFAIEFASVQDLISGTFTLGGGGGKYEASLPTSILLSLIGHIFLLAALFFKNYVEKFFSTWIGLAALIVSLIIISVQAKFIWGMIFLFSLPFLLAAIWSVILSARQYNERKLKTSDSLWDEGGRTTSGL